MVVKFVSASVAPLTMFCIFLHVRIANVTVKLIVIFVEFDPSQIFFPGEAKTALQGNSWVCRITCCNHDRGEDHRYEARNVKNSEDNHAVDVRIFSTLMYE